MINVTAAKTILIKHGPSILSGAAVAGVVLTALLTHRADKKLIGAVAEAALFDEDTETPTEEIVKHQAVHYWKNYIPAGICGLLTIGCVIGSNRWHLSKEGALAAAALMYKTGGEDLEKKLRGEFGDRPPWEDRNPAKMMIYDPYTDQWFQATQQEILWAELTANKMLQQRGVVTLNDILSMYKGTRKTKKGQTLGWSYSDDAFDEMASYYTCGAWIDLCPQIIINPDGTTYMQMEYGIHPGDISHLDE